MELLVDADIMSGEERSDLMHEANDLIAITVSFIKTARERKH
jgi:hypothetical protein